MKRETITISVPPRMRQFILARGSSEFRSASEYIRELVLRDLYFQRTLKRHQNAATHRKTCNSGVADVVKAARRV